MESLLNLVAPSILGIFFPVFTAVITLGILLFKILNNWKFKQKVPDFYKEERDGKKYFELTSGKRVYISKEFVPYAYVGWIYKKLATREELLEMGFTGKIITSDDGETWNYVEARSMEPLNKMANKHGGHFYIRAFTAIDENGDQLDPRFQSLWSVDCFVRNTTTWISSYDQPEKGFLQKLREAV